MSPETFLCVFMSARPVGLVGWSGVHIGIGLLKYQSDVCLCKKKALEQVTNPALFRTGDKLPHPRFPISGFPSQVSHLSFPSGFPISCFPSQVPHLWSGMECCPACVKRRRRMRQPTKDLPRGGGTNIDMMASFRTHACKQSKGSWVVSQSVSQSGEVESINNNIMNPTPCNRLVSSLCCQLYLLLHQCHSHSGTRVIATQFV